MAIATSILVDKSGGRRVYHTRKAPPDNRRPAETQNAVTHAWEHPADDATIAACVACTAGKLPKEVR